MLRAPMSKEKRECERRFRPDTIFVLPLVARVYLYVYDPMYKSTNLQPQTRYPTHAVHNYYYAKRVRSEETRINGIGRKLYYFTRRHAYYSYYCKRNNIIFILVFIIYTWPEMNVLLQYIFYFHVFLSGPVKFAIHQRSSKTLIEIHCPS